MLHSESVLHHEILKYCQNTSKAHAKYHIILWGHVHLGTDGLKPQLSSLPSVLSCTYELWR